MSSPLELVVYDRNRVVHRLALRHPVELGRQNVGELAPYHAIEQSGSPPHARLIIAPLAEASVARKHALLEPLSDGRLHVINLSTSVPIRFGDGTELPCSQARDVLPPVSLGLGAVQVRVMRAREEPIQSLAMRSLAPGTLLTSRELRTPSGLSSLQPDDLKSLVLLLKTVMDVLDNSANDNQFFHRAADAAVRIVHFDSARVLQNQQGRWRSSVCCPPDQDSRAEEWLPSRTIVEHVCNEKKVYWRLPEAMGEMDSLYGVSHVIAAPILDRNGQVVAILYGERSSAKPLSQRPIEDADAHLMDLLAHAVSVAMARKEAESARGLLEQFLSPDLARQFSPADLEQGRNAEVAVLVCDVRGFSSVAEHHGPEVTVEWIRDVMTEMSQCVRDFDGVLVDYIGDEMMAMWGAPKTQTDHVERAAHAAQAMIRRLRRLDGRWLSRISLPTRIGIGINVGDAFVGNVGSKIKFKYGPIGNVVNLASRVQGATKYLKIPVLLTRGVHERLSESEFPRRRLCDVRVSGIKLPVRLFELQTEPADAWRDLKAGYETALAHYEGHDPRAAAGLLGRILEQHPSDHPALVLLNRAVEVLTSEAEAYDPIWPLPGK